MNRRVLVLLAHPALEKSRVNRRMASAAASVDGVTLHDLYQHYPDFFIRREREQELLLEHDVVVTQHPMYWYNVPALVKEWQDIVLQDGFAYGADGDKLQGKLMLNAVSCNSLAEEFGRDGPDGSWAELMLPFRRTARYCSVRYAPPFVMCATATRSREQIIAHSELYRRLLRRLVGDASLAWLDEPALTINELLGDQVRV
jgi:glutathione-regulated potassium-efflux system ancillary protein KefG